MYLGEPPILSELDIKLPKSHWLLGKCILVYIYIQYVVLIHLVKWLSSVWYALQIDGEWQCRTGALEDLHRDLL